MTDPNKALVVDHHNNAPTDGSRCLLCLDPIDGPFVVIRVGKTWQLQADDDCWNQLVELVEVVFEEAHKERQGVITH